LCSALPLELLSNMSRGPRFSILLFAVPLLTLTGCYKATFVNPTVAPGPKVERWTEFYLFGLVGHEEVDVRLLCPGEVAAIRTGGNVATGVVTVLTLGIYAPRKIYVTCAGAGPARKPAPAAPHREPPANVPSGPSQTVAPGASAQASLSPVPSDDEARR
jgi:hypothetical protein